MEEKNIYNDQRPINEEERASYYIYEDFKLKKCFSLLVYIKIAQRFQG